MANSNLETLLIVFVALTGLAVLMQACVLLGIFLTVRKAVQVGKEQADEYRTKITPLLATSRELVGTAKDLISATKDLVSGLQPQLEAAAAELSGMARDIHTQANHLQVSVDEVAQKARRQADRVDGMTTSVLNGLDRFGSFVNEAVHVPIRQVNGVMAAAKAVVQTLKEPPVGRSRPQSGEARVAAEKDLFI